MVEKDLLYLSRRDLEPLLTMREVLQYTEEANGLYVKSKAGQNPASFSLMSAFHTKIPNSDIDYRAGTMDPIPHDLLHTGLRLRRQPGEARDLWPLCPGCTGPAG